ncbi:DJ-1/PfpI family protein [Paenibacillus sp. UMB7766-LJ446]|uniref:DJ-1/PfpI family protein n=1 Tax=Paenibacillus sp. UMB7766-LJ446 TaxID=3046313 RepID=UPI00254D1E4C|nr:DJ-1/PfpI family protein [Paenibacillus sp. UMB7766-LJ446]MDK8189064.1 DJ-1/PfpI family protein [Paenibacillus sp. UMB7766-LJ446]
MKTYILLFEGYVSFEIMLACYFMKTQGDIMTVAVEKGMLQSYEGFSVNPSALLNEIDPSEVDLFIIPGGNVTAVLQRPDLMNLLKELNERKTPIAAICAGTLLLGQAQVLESKTFTTNAESEMRAVTAQGEYVNQGVVVDGHIITAKANAYVDFGIEIGKVMNIYTGPEDLEETILVFKYFNAKA